MNDMSSSASAAQSLTAHLIGRHVIVRAHDAGVHAGILVAQKDREVSLTNSRRLWYWKCAKGHTLSGVALHGLAKGSKIAGAVTDQLILDACEIITTTDEARASIEEFAAHEP